MHKTSRRVSLPPFPVLLQVVYWAVSLGFILYVSLLSFTYSDALQRSALVFICQLVNFYVCYSFLVPRFYEKRRYRQAVAGVIILLLILTPLRIYIENRFESIAQTAAPQFLARRTMVGFTVFSELAIVVIASVLRLAVSHERSKIRIAELEKMQLETELRFLKAQMNPHFLFNTINNIYSLVLVKSDLAPPALMKLSSLLRYLLYESQGKVELEKEEEAIRAFIELYELRSAAQKNIRFQNHVGRKDILIEPHLLLPLLENAVKHSGTGTVPGAVVSMELKEEAGRLHIEVCNSIAGIPVSKEASGIGLANIRKRLELTYPGNHELMIREEEKTFSVNLSIPIL